MTLDSDIALETALRGFNQKWESIRAIPEDPRSLMSVIEYGLGKQKRAEVYVNRLLRYLLHPEEPHGIETDLLEAFLRNLPESFGFEEDTYDLASVRVNEQVAVENRDDPDSSTGYVDLVLDVPNEWFLMIELKFSAEETGTEFYCNGTHVDGHPVSEYESGQYYLYMHQQNRPQANGCCFSNWTWKSFVEDLLDDFIAENAARYPQRTVTQLHDLRYDLRNLSAMSDHQDTDEKKIALYLDYVNAIEDVRNTFDDAWEAYSNSWGERLATSLESDGITARLPADHGLPEVTIPRENGDDDRWIFRDTGGDWQVVMKNGWYRHEETNEILVERDENYNDLRIGYYHRMGRNRDTAVRDHTLEFNFRCMGSNPTDFRDIFLDKFDSNKDELEGHLSQIDYEFTGHKSTLIRGWYDIRVDEYGDFFEAYTGALEAAFRDFVVDNPELIHLIDRLFEESIAVYTESSH